MPRAVFKSSNKVSPSVAALVATVPQRCSSTRAKADSASVPCPADKRVAANSADFAASNFAVPAAPARSRAACART